MGPFKGDAQLLWNQFSELREPQVKSFYSFFQILSCLFLLSALFSAFSCLFIFIRSCFHSRLLYPTTYCFSSFPSYLFPFIFPLSIVAFCPKTLDWKICSSQTIFPISCMITKVEAHKIETPFSQNLTKFTKVIGVGRDLSPHYYTYLADYNR